VLDPDVTFRIDNGGSAPLARSPITGAPAVARQLLARGTQFAPRARSAIVNGAAGLVVRSGPELRAVIGFTVVAGRITAVDVITDDQKLRGLAEPGPPTVD